MPGSSDAHRLSLQRRAGRAGKHYRNIWVDLCWAWSIDPYSARDFVRRFLHAVPINKLFAFGGDTTWPSAALAYALQARRGICGALEAELADGVLDERQAMTIATRIMRVNHTPASTWRAPGPTSAALPAPTRQVEASG